MSSLLYRCRHSASRVVRSTQFDRRASTARSDAPSAPLNATSATVTQPAAQGASQAMLIATGLTKADLAKPQIGKAHVWR
jgi:dihydroxy-acid dehydratase